MNQLIISKDKFNGIFFNIQRRGTIFCKFAHIV